MKWTVVLESLFLCKPFHPDELLLLELWEVVLVDFQFSSLLQDTTLELYEFLIYAPFMILFYIVVDSEFFSCCWVVCEVSFIAAVLISSFSLNLCSWSETNSHSSWNANRGNSSPHTNRGSSARRRPQCNQPNAKIKITGQEGFNWSIRLMLAISRHHIYLATMD